MIKLKKKLTLNNQTNDGKCPRLEDWHRVYPFGTLSKTHITGTVYDHPRFDDGEHILTSNVVRMGYSWAQTRNTFYILGRKQKWAN